MFPFVEEPMWRRTEEPKAQPSLETPAVHPSSEAPRPAAERAAPSAIRPESARISLGICVKGDITGREDLYVDGEVQGSIRITGANVTIGPNGRLAARVEAQEISVEGNVQGDLVGSDRVQIRCSGWVTGKVHTPRLAIEEGAFFSGEVEMVRPGEALRAPRSEKAAAAAASGSSGAGLLSSVRTDTKDSIH